MSNAAQYTKWHRFLECVCEYETLCSPDGSAIERVMLDTYKVVNGMGYKNRDIPVFKVEKESLFGIKIDDFELFSDSVDFLPWPFESFLIEVDIDDNATIFGHIMKSGEKTFGYHLFSYLNASDGDSGLWAESACEPTEVGRQNRTLNKNMVEFEGNQQGCNDRSLILHFCFMSLMMELATKGMIQERIEAPTALNKQRARKGKPPIPTVIHMRPGHYYDREGKQHVCDDRKPVRIHWRRGHVRNIWCGAGDARRREPRYISPCLVNYDGGEIPNHSVRVLH